MEVKINLIIDPEYLEEIEKKKRELDRKIECFNLLIMELPKHIVVASDKGEKS